MRLSIVLRVVGGGDFLERCLAALTPQVASDEIEVIVPHDERVAGLESLRARYPATYVHVADTPASGRVPESAHDRFDQRTAAGLWVAGGEIVALLEDYGRPAPDWIERIQEAHRAPHEVIGGPIVQLSQRPTNRALYLLDFGRFEPPLPAGPVGYLSDVNVSYKRAALESVRHVWRVRYNEALVHHAMRERGATLWLDPSIVVHQDRGALSFAALLRERVEWGRHYGAVRIETVPGWQRLVYAAASPLIPLVMLARAVTRARARGTLDRRLIAAFPPLTVLTTAWCVGEFLGYSTGRIR